VRVKEQTQWRVGEGIGRRPTLECVLARLCACGVAQVARGRGRGSERGVAVRWVACEDDLDLA
jgi:hypothetical protein